MARTVVNTAKTSRLYTVIRAVTENNATYRHKQHVKTLTVL